MSEHTLDYTTVRHVNLTPLREAVREWAKLPKEFREVHRTFDRTVSKPLSTPHSGWHGDAKNAAFKSFTGVQEQVLEASRQAHKVGTVMSEALADIEAAKKELEAIETALTEPKGGGKSWLKLNEKTGTVEYDPPDDVDPRTRAKHKPEFDVSIAAYNDRIKKAIKKASDADHDLKTALLLNPAGKGFNDNVYGHLADVDKETKADVKTALNLAKDEGNEMSQKELSKLNGILAKNANNPDFAEKFTLGMGPKGTLDFWYNMAKPEYKQNGAAGSVRVERSKAETQRLAALQDNLGAVLGLASNSDSPRMTEWKKDVLDISMDRINAEDAKGRPYADKGPYNAQVLSNLMRTGKWDKDFLHDYGDKLLAKDKEAAMNGPTNDPTSKWISGGLSDSAFLNFGPKNDAGEDPVTGFMEALGHNPEASTEFLKDEKNFDYLTSKRDWPEDGEVADEGKLKDVKGGVQALSHAMASATTGHPFDEPMPKDVPPHTKDQAELMSRIINKTANVEDDFALKPGMHEYIGKAAAEYTPDIFRAIKDGSNGDKLFPMQGHQAEMDHAEATRFLVQVGQDPDANAALNYGQKTYTGQVLEHHLAGDLPANERYNSSRDQTVEEILRTSGEVSGTMAIGRQEAIIGPAVREAKEFDSATLSGRMWGNGAFGTIVYGVSAMERFSGNPVSAVVVSSLIGSAESAWANDFDREYLKRDETIEKADAAGKIYDEMARRDVQQNEKILQHISDKHGVKVSDSWSELYSDDGFAQGYSRVNTTAPFLTSHEQVSTLAAGK
ncbi:hypothetical protein ACQEU8_17395 [Streptomyces sp. CA-250714]|uniref:hypothetical protein n=1 Tax=Streptomyces sp. CA-250714 TaxID=3240060 RepID=UPI003D8D5406